MVSCGFTRPCWKERRRPSRARRCGGTPSRGTSPSITRPLSGVTKPESTSIRVDLPAPFGPISPCTVPFLTVRPAPWMAFTAP